MRSIFCASPGRRKLHRNCLQGDRGGRRGSSEVNRLDVQNKTGTVSPGTEPAERGERPPEGLDEVEVGELVEVNEGLQYFEVEVIPEGAITHTRVSMSTS